MNRKDGGPWTLSTTTAGARRRHRGTKEMDILLGGFAEARLDAMSEDELDAFEALLNIPDQDFYNMLVKEDAVPPAYDGPMMRDLIRFAETRFEES
jgi:antitoxin CptB